MCKHILLVSLRGRVKLESVTLLAFNCLPSPFLPLWRQNQEQRKCGFEKRWKHLFTCGALSSYTPCLPCTRISAAMFPPSLKLLGAYKPMSPWGILTQFNQSKHGEIIKIECAEDVSKLIVGPLPRLTSFRIISSRSVGSTNKISANKCIFG